MSQFNPLDIWQDKITELDKELQEASEPEVIKKTEERLKEYKRIYEKMKGVKEKLDKEKKEFKSDFVKLPGCTLQGVSPGTKITSTKKINGVVVEEKTINF